MGEEQKNNGIFNSGTALGAGLNLISNGLQMYHDNRMMEQNQAYQQQMIADEREYNSPANQVRRMRDAGLNPMANFGNFESPQVGAQSPVQGDSSALPAMNLSQYGLANSQIERNEAGAGIDREREESLRKLTEKNEKVLENLAKKYDFDAQLSDQQRQNLIQNFKSNEYQTFVNKLKESIMKYHVMDKLYRSDKLREAINSQSNQDLKDFFESFDWDKVWDGTYSNDQEAINTLGMFISLALNNTVQFTSEQELLAYFDEILKVVGSVPEQQNAKANTLNALYNSVDYQYYQEHPGAVPQRFQVNSVYSGAYLIGNMAGKLLHDKKEQENHNGKSPYEGDK